jgi:hypothetical protein
MDIDFGWGSTSICTGADTRIISCPFSGPFSTTAPGRQWQTAQARRVMKRDTGSPPLPSLIWHSMRSCFVSRHRGPLTKSAHFV